MRDDSPVEPLYEQNTATADSIGRIRRTVRCWLAGTVDDAVLDDVVLAVSEALENAVDHAFLEGRRGSTTIRGRVRGVTPRALEISVTDDGRWAYDTDPRGRGRGLQLIAGLCTNHELATGPDGTCVAMSWSLDEPLQPVVSE